MGFVHMLDPDPNLYLHPVHHRAATLHFSACGHYLDYEETARKAHSPQAAMQYVSKCFWQKQFPAPTAAVAAAPELRLQSPLAPSLWVADIVIDNRPMPASRQRLSSLVGFPGFQNPITSGGTYTPESSVAASLLYEPGLLLCCCEEISEGIKLADLEAK
ncbi:hypothetical protein FIBSPDRAFT_936347 [Athelia psychrophila]|uniref:Uncharacterized protein n=1 Tax=Athelia psychrophila TaxID=1759441 RepID=A0A166CBF5_9AGAM|nr:hypothetical protein FIBSPDRAFT_936347 [Fibularhizoctonia sp. CBS 109695]